MAQSGKQNGRGLLSRIFGKTDAQTHQADTSFRSQRADGESVAQPNTPPARTNTAPAPDEPATPTQPDTQMNGRDAAESTRDFFTRSFGLKTRAFTLLPDPDVLFWSDGHRRAFSVLEYGIMTRAPITVITGDVGAGKTTLLQALLETVPDDTIVGLISNAHGNRGELLRWALSSLDVPCDRNASYVETFQVLQDFLVRNYAQGRYAILVIDEAQQLTSEGLEELRMLTNINSKKDELLQLILVGQPELRQMIEQPSMSQFAQRVMARYHLGPLPADVTPGYIAHRLVTAGGKADSFTTDAKAYVHEISGGVPRIINKICDFAIVYAVTNGKKTVDKEIVESVVADGLLQGAIPLQGDA